MNYNILLSGVGGQGLMLLSAVIGEACTHNNLNVVTAEQHGLAQRSGAISAHIRIGDAISPLIPYGTADMIISMEAMEALRYIEYLKPDGVIITNTRIMHPVIETNQLVQNRKSDSKYIELPEIIGTLKKVTKNIVTIDARKLASQAGNPRTENIVLLGTASKQAGFPLNDEQIKESIARIVPKRTIEANLKAFDLGAE
jgi:indolepyruvate ferredoxin oxidoreductase beta subunit